VVDNAALAIDQPINQAFHIQHVVHSALLRVADK
jgi:hypothetical protein